MTFFPDLPPYAYGKHAKREPDVLMIGWLDIREPFSTGETSSEFHAALAQLCQNPIMKHRGYHVCQFCEVKKPIDWKYWSSIGNGQIRVVGRNGQMYSAPTMIHHYVVVHQYKPPEVFIDAVIAASKQSVLK